MATKNKTRPKFLDDVTYLPTEEYEFGVVADKPGKPKNKQFGQRVYATRRPRLTPEQWQEYWGNQGAAAVNRARDKVAPYFMAGAGLAAAPALLPYVSAIITNPYVDAALTTHGLLTAPENIRKGVSNFKEGNYASGAVDFGSVGLDLLGAGLLVNKARRFVTPILTKGKVTNKTLQTTPKELAAIQDIATDPNYLVDDFIRRYGDKSKYIVDIAEDYFNINPNLQFVDYKAMNDYGKVFNKRIKRTLPLAKKRGTLRTNVEPNVIIADAEGRQFLYNKFINDTPTLPGRPTIHYGDPLTNKGKLAKEYYYKTEPATSVFDNNPHSFADRANNTIVAVPHKGYKNMYEYAIPHEKTHIFIDGKKEAELFGADRGFGIRPHKPGDIDIDLDIYLANPNEQLARGTQIKNYLGITDESPITPEQLKYAAENYVKDTGYDNNMTEFFSTIKDYKKAAKWLSLAPAVLPFLNVGAASNFTNKNSSKFH